MLYLEDYLEMIEHLPQELRDRFTEMRELDLTVQNNMDSLEKKTRNFFQQCKRGELLHESADSEFHHLRKEYYKVMEDADEKVAIATQIHELVERYLRRLDSELFKFKCELEADNNGITEILEKRSLELDGHTNSSSTALLLSMNQKENRYYGSSLMNSPGISTNNISGIVIAGSGLGVSSGATIGVTGGGNSVSGVNVGNNSVSSSGLSNAHTSQPKQRRLEKRRETICSMTVPEKRPNMNHSLANISSSSNQVIAPIRPLSSSFSTHPVLGSNATNVTTPTAVTYNLQQLGGTGSSAIAAAASQAIVATQQMQQGRRTASLKASYEAIHGGAGVNSTDFWIANATVAAHNVTTTAPMPSSSTPSVHYEKKQKKKLNHQHSVALAANLNPSSAGSVASSTSSSMSMESIDIASATAATTLSNCPVVSGNSSVASSSISLLPGIVTAVNSTTNNTLPSNAVNCLPSTSIAPGANITINENGMVVEQTNEGEWSYDPNEPRYCTCNQVSYGDMVACDNDACPYEWFHYPCVGITQPPKGKWYCPKCIASMRRRGSRKN